MLTETTGIRSAILDGDIDRALKYTHAFYPRVLAENEHVNFKLKCRKFIEMVRKAAQLNMAAEQTKLNGRSTGINLPAGARKDLLSCSQHMASRSDAAFHA